MTKAGILSLNEDDAKEQELDAEAQGERDQAFMKRPLHRARAMDLTHQAHEEHIKMQVEKRRREQEKKEQKQRQKADKGVRKRRAEKGKKNRTADKTAAKEKSAELSETMGTIFTEEMDRIFEQCGMSLSDDDEDLLTRAKRKREESQEEQQSVKKGKTTEKS